MKEESVEREICNFVPPALYRINRGNIREKFMLSRHIRIVNVEFIRKNASEAKKGEQELIISFEGRLIHPIINIQTTTGY
jgi:hypothetical protein